mmetsp:Transcript_71782/g.207914  ORF Transcript_71782/g.207914 Transcript_71782/m.207914 type:complete len:238 (+) Transcript_71782:635-1348(+)
MLCCSLGFPATSGPPTKNTRTGRSSNVPKKCSHAASTSDSITSTFDGMPSSSACQEPTEMKSSSATASEAACCRKRALGMRPVLFDSATSRSEAMENQPPIAAYPARSSRSLAWCIIATWPRCTGAKRPRATSNASGLSCPCASAIQRTTFLMGHEPSGGGSSKLRRLGMHSSGTSSSSASPSKMSAITFGVLLRTYKGSRFLIARLNKSVVKSPMCLSRVSSAVNTKSSGRSSTRS